MNYKAANGVGPGAGKGAKREAEERAIRNAKRRAKVYRALTGGVGFFERLEVAQAVRYG